MTGAMEIVIAAQYKLVYSSMHMIFILAVGAYFLLVGFVVGGEISFLRCFRSCSKDPGLVLINSKMNVPFSSLNASTFPPC